MNSGMGQASPVEESDVCAADQKAPMGLDDPAPLLVWRWGGKARYFRDPVPGFAFAFPSSQAAIDADRLRYDVEGTALEPFRVVLDEYVRSTKARGFKGVALVDGNLRVLEVYK